ncbi:MAG: sulfonate transport system substrate-binding protein, partial [Candidatus Binatota bacterium]|nr:sulfonate transport system substrate-binding protein [Candidatus Binatota bacterium]
MTTSRPFVATAVLLVGALAVAACGSNDSPKADAATSKQQGTTSVTDVARDIPSGASLRVGDQLDYLKTALATGKQDQHYGFDLKYAAFVGGPAMLQAFKAGAIDIGYVADTPLIFAQAAHQDIVAIAAWAPEHGSLELIAPPGSNVASWGDLKGKKVAYQQGTVLEAVVLQGLDKVGLSLQDIKTVNLPVTEISAALQSGSVDAAVLA